MLITKVDCFPNPRQRLYDFTWTWKSQHLTCDVHRKPVTNVELWCGRKFHTHNMCRQLADKDKDTKLNLDEFIVGMHLVTLAIRGDMPEIPKSLDFLDAGATQSSPTQELEPPSAEVSHVCGIVCGIVCVVLGVCGNVSAVICGILIAWSCVCGVFCGCVVLWVCWWWRCRVWTCWRCGFSVWSSGTNQEVTSIGSRLLGCCFKRTVFKGVLLFTGYYHNGNQLQMGPFNKYRPLCMGGGLEHSQKESNPTPIYSNSRKRNNIMSSAQICAKYCTMFDKFDQAGTGRIPASKVHAILTKSGLPSTVLLLIGPGTVYCFPLKCTPH